MWGFISSVPHFIFCGSHGRPSLLFYFFLKGGVEKREKSMVSLHCQEYQWNYSIVVMKLGFLGMTVKFLLGGCVQDGFSFDRFYIFTWLNAQAEYQGNLSQPEEVLVHLIWSIINIFWSGILFKSSLEQRTPSQ